MTRYDNAYIYAQQEPPTRLTAEQAYAQLTAEYNRPGSDQFAGATGSISYHLAARWLAAHSEDDLETCEEFALDWWLEEKMLSDEE